MTFSGSGEEAVIQGIFSEAREEAAKIRREAEEKAEKEMSEARSQCDRIRKQAEERAADLRESILVAERSAVEAELRRQALSEQEKIYSEFFIRLRNQLSTRMQADSYLETLREWIVEGAEGLGCGSVELVVSRKERHLIDDDLLRQCEKELLDQTGESVRLGIAPEDGEGQGVFLRDDSGRLAYDNRVDARIRRARRDLVRIVAEALENAKKVQE